VTKNLSRSRRWIALLFGILMSLSIAGPALADTTPAASPDGVEWTSAGGDSSTNGIEWTVVADGGGINGTDGVEWT
jgi:hypothetical protein